MIISHLEVINYVKNNIENAIIRQLAAIYGDFLSPILAHFQNVPVILQCKITKSLTLLIKY